MIVYDHEAIENVNNVMLFALDYANFKFGKEYVIEDGRITEIHIFCKSIKDQKRRMENDF